MFGLGLLLVGIGIASAKHEAYDGHTLYKVNVNNSDEASFFNFLGEYLNLDVWSHGTPNRSGLVLVPGYLKKYFENEIWVAGIKYEIEVENIKEMLDLEDRLMASVSNKGLSFNRTKLKDELFDRIYNYAEINEYLEDLAKSYPDTVSLVNAGKSFERRDIKYLRISSTKFQDTGKPVIFMQSLLHAREWITLPVTLYAIHKLVVDVTDKDMVQDVDWVILPIANPDGYEYTHNKFRFWRKNRSTGNSIGNICIGVDLNRNFDVNWSITSSKIPCSETYHGQSFFSEPETAIIRDIFTEYGSRIEQFFDIHSFGSLLLYGYGTGELPENSQILQTVGITIADTIDTFKMSWNPNYTVGNVAQVLYKASGSAQDYAQAVGVPLSYTIELPGYRYGLGTGLGFLVDPSFIEQAGMETWEGIRVGAKFVLDNFRLRKNIYSAMGL